VRYGNLGACLLNHPIFSDWTGFVGRVFGSQGDENGSYVEEKDSKADYNANSVVKRK
jgi:hypothetical protein